MISKMIFTDFMVLNEKEVSFEKKRPRRFLPGSTAESEVRPPNMSWFWERFWPPKAMFEQTRFGRRTSSSAAEHGGVLHAR